MSRFHAGFGDKDAVYGRRMAKCMASVWQGVGLGGMVSVSDGWNLGAIRVLRGVVGGSRRLAVLVLSAGSGAVRVGWGFTPPCRAGDARVWAGTVRWKLALSLLR